jgi:PKD repeat protein
MCLLSRLLAAGVVSLALANADRAIAQLSALGPVSPDNGFPAWYRDGSGTQLDLCLSNPTLCALLAPVQLTSPNQPFPLNYGGTFPDESFYSLVTADMVSNNNGRVLLVIALEAGFVNGVVVPGEQMVFARLRVRADNLVAGATYHITTPYGTFDQVATGSARRGINFTQDIGLVAGAFTQALNGGIGPFLRWDSGLPLIDNLGDSFVGDPVLLHTITGSPSGNNVFRIDGPNVGGTGVNTISTNQFAVTGKQTRVIPPPVAAIGANPTSGTAPLTVAFADLSLGLVTSRNWDFGDGSGSTAANPSHVYSAPGSYTVSLLVSGPGGTNTATSPNLITVNAPAQPPAADFSASPTSGAAPLPVAFTNLSTGSITSQSWDFGDGSSSTAANPSHVYGVAGTFTVSLTVTGPGGSDTRTRANLITVDAPAQAPVADFRASPTSGQAPLSVAFTNLSTGSITARSWDFGDGASSSAANPTHVYNRAGTFMVRLTVTGPGGSDTRTVPGMISVTAPNLVLDTPTPGIAPGRNTFTASGASPGGEVFLLWSTSLGSSSAALAGCTLVTGLDTPLVLAHRRAQSSTITWTVNLHRRLAGQTVRLQAVDTRVCSASNVVTEIF